MNSSFNEARLAVQKAREALRNNDRSAARQLAEQAALLAPQMEDPWLILAAVASPPASLDYVQKALKLDPESPRAQRAMQWAMQRLNDPLAAIKHQQGMPDTPPAGDTPQASSVITPSVTIDTSPKKSSALPRSRRTSLFPILLLGLGVLVCGLAAWSASSSPVVASILKQTAAEPTRPPSWAQVSLPKPTYTPAASSDLAFQLQDTPTPILPPTLSPSDIPADLPTDQPTEMAADAPTVQPPVVDSPADASVPTAEPTGSDTLSMEFVQDTPTSVIPTNAPAPKTLPSSPGDMVNTGQHWIDVNLTQQMVYAYSGNTVVNSFLVSTGTWDHPTVTGQYHIYVKLRYTDMSGPDYYLPNVPYTMYFYQGYGLHGTYWHHNFGTPMSHGCVNLATPDAAWLYDFASVGTLVNVHY